MQEELIVSAYRYFCKKYFGGFSSYNIAIIFYVFYISWCEKILKEIDERGIDKCV